MDKQVLYQKYRPESFEEIFGQEHIIKVLKGSLEQGTVGHAYIFSGPRGTGKTTTARIFARALGCSSNDIVEMDAASNRKIEDVRALRESVLSLPFDSEKKVYILDEAHMLTKEAFNAFLKTLEEPPAHVIFILATTELDKIPITIASRCQIFNFRAPTQKLLKEMISKVVERESYHIDEGALDLVAILGNGSYRDTQGVLQKLMSYSADKELTREEVESVTGAPRQTMIHELLTAINERNAEKALEIIHEAESNNTDPVIFLELLTRNIRSVLQIRFSPKRAGEIKEDLGEDQYLFLESLAKDKNNIHSALLSKILETYGKISSAFLKYAPIELAILEIIDNNE